MIIIFRRCLSTVRYQTLQSMTELCIAMLAKPENVSFVFWDENLSIESMNFRRIEKSFTGLFMQAVTAR